MAGYDEENPDFRTQPITGRGGSATEIPGISGQSLNYLPGDVVDNDYQLTRLLGQGGMGAVFACRHRQLNQEYALKLLSGQAMTGEGWSRFQVEAKVLAKLKHPGIVSIYNMGIDKNQCPYYVMDLLKGEPLNLAISRRGQLQVEETLDIYIQVADALSSAHGQGVIHRDIKPSNLMLTEDLTNSSTSHRVKLVDFGIARLSKQGENTQSQTATGLVFGTPFYMSPEQCDGQRVDERSDVYSLGCALFETLTGEPPYVGTSAVQTLMMHQSKRIPTLASRSQKQKFPDALESAVQKMLAKNPAERYQTMAQLKHDLERIRAGKSISPQGVSAANLRAPDPIYDEDRTEGGERRRNKKNSPMPIPLLAGISALILSLAAGAFYLASNHKSAAPPPAGKDWQRDSEQHLANDPIAKYAKGHLDESDTIKGPETLDAGEPTYSALPFDELKLMGATEAELKKVTSAKLLSLKSDCIAAKARFTKLFDSPGWRTVPFKSDGAFHFPQDVCLGAIQIGNAVPVSATGLVKAPDGERACLYTLTSLKERREILDKFGPNDLNGLAMVFYSSDIALNKLKTWNKLDDLWFFNPLLKTLPTNADWEESDMADTFLYKLDILPHLQSLGLCHPVSGEGIIKMPSLRRLTCLRIKRIFHAPYLYQNIKRYPNIRELWISSQDTKDEELEYLIEMPRLERLTIKRSMLTPGAINNFAKMKHLKYLCLDRNDWTKAQKGKLQTLLPHCKIVYESVVDTRYWDLLPQKK